VAFARTSAVQARPDGGDGLCFRAQSGPGSSCLARHSLRLHPLLAWQLNLRQVRSTSGQSQARALRGLQPASQPAARSPGQHALFSLVTVTHSFARPTSPLVCSIPLHSVSGHLHRRFCSPTLSARNHPRLHHHAIKNCRFCPAPCPLSIRKASEAAGQWSRRGHHNSTSSPRLWQHSSQFYTSDEYPLHLFQMPAR
jgi:hypothetical protein